MKLALALLLSLICLKSIACSCPQGLGHFYRNAKSAHLIFVTSATLKHDYVEVKFDVIEDLYGSAIAPETIRTNNDNCSLQLYPGREFVVFIPKNIELKNTVDSCTGIYPLNLNIPKHQKNLADIKAFIQSRE